MKSIKFQEQNTTLRKSNSITDEACMSLPCFTDGIKVISKWKLTKEDIVHINEREFIWVKIFSGVTQPPIYLEAKEDIFQMTDLMYMSVPSEIR